jgi:hypothetical protein
MSDFFTLLRIFIFSVTVSCASEVNSAPHPVHRSSLPEFHWPHSGHFIVCSFQVLIRCYGLSSDCATITLIPRADQCQV